MNIYLGKKAISVRKLHGQLAIYFKWSKSSICCWLLHSQYLGRSMVLHSLPE